MGIKKKSARGALAALAVFLLLLVLLSSQWSLYLHLSSSTPPDGQRHGVAAQQASLLPTPGPSITSRRPTVALSSGAPTPPAPADVLEDNSNRTCIHIPIRTSRVSKKFTDQLSAIIRRTTSTLLAFSFVVSSERPQAAVVVSKEIRQVFQQHKSVPFGIFVAPHNATLAGMINLGLFRSRERNGGEDDVHCSYHLLLDPTRLPARGLFVERLWRDAQSTNASLLSCTTVRRVSDLQRNETVTVIFDRGYNITLAQASGRTTPAVSRNMFGYSAGDVRTQQLESSQFISPYCVLMPAKVLRAMRYQLPMDRVLTLTDTTASGESSVVRVIQEAEVLNYLQKSLSVVMSKLSVASLKHLPDSSRAVVRHAFNSILEAQKLLKAIHGEQWNSLNLSGVARHQIRRDEVRIRNCTTTFGSDIVSILGCIYDMVKEQHGLLTSLRAVDAGNLPEEFFGWVLSAEAHRLGFHNVFVSPEYAVVDSDGAAPSVAAFFNSQTNTHVIDRPSYLVPADGSWWDEYSAAVERTFPHLRPVSGPLLRVVWDSYCCHCCGFSNEIVHLVYPLQKRYDVRTPLASDCFCTGFLPAVSDVIERLHMPADSFPIERRSKDEVVVWVSHTDPTRFPNEIFNTRSPDYFIGRSMYEFTKILDIWTTGFDAWCDEVWVPARFVARVFERNGVDPTRIFVVPEAVDAFYFDAAVHSELALPPAGPTSGHWKYFCNREIPEGRPPHFKFFSNFKWESRKGWDILFSAYFTGFQSDDAVSLYILTHIWKNGGPETFVSRHNQTYLNVVLSELAASLGFSSLLETPHFCIITDDMSESEIARLYRSTDAFVLPTRGEGWGLPAIQAMAMGRPVITTAWGGQLEFLRPDCAFMIPIDGLEEIPVDSEYVYLPGKKWALPSLSSTRALMQLVVQNRTLADEVGRRARQHVIRYFSEEAVVEVIATRLEAIKQKFANGYRRKVELRSLQPTPVPSTKKPSGK